jgi:hypothetical protein
MAARLKTTMEIIRNAIFLPQVHDKIICPKSLLVHM